MRKAHVIDGVAIYESEYDFDGFYLSPSDAKRANPETLVKIEEWCRKNYRAHYAADIFGHLGYNFDSQFMDIEDLYLIAEVFKGEHIAARAIAEKERINRGERHWSAKQSVRRKVSGHVYLVEGANGVYKIGKTSQLHARMNFFEIKLPFDVNLICAIPSEDITTLEKQLHDKYANKRIRGEWFELTEQDVEDIKQLIGEEAT